MSMAEPLLPASSDRSAHTPAAEPGPGGPQPAPEEPDVLDGPPGEGATPESPATRDAVFRTPTPGDKLHPEDLSLDTP